MIRGGRGWWEKDRTVKQRKWGTRQLEPNIVGMRGMATTAPPLSAPQLCSLAPSPLASAVELGPGNGKRLGWEEE